MLPLVLPVAALGAGLVSLGVGVYESTKRPKAKPPEDAPVAPKAEPGATGLQQGIPPELSAATQAVLQFGQDPITMERMSAMMSEYGYEELAKPLWDRAGELRKAQERATKAVVNTMPTLPTGNPVLKQGSAGPDVVLWQQFLNSRGAGLVVDGKFGQNTASATVAFQKSAGITADGAVGPKTIAAAKATMGGVSGLASLKPSPTPQAEVTALVQGVGVRLRSAPGVNSALLGHLSSPESVLVLALPDKRWAKVRTSKGQVGFVHQKYLMLGAPMPPAVSGDALAFAVGAESSSPYVAKCVAPSGCRLRNAPNPTSSFKALVGNGESVTVLRCVSAPKAERKSPGAGGWALVRYKRLNGWLPLEWLV